MFETHSPEGEKTRAVDTGSIGPAQRVTEPVERISHNGQPLAFIIRRELAPVKTTFPTPENLNLQVGFIVYPPGGEVPRHRHLPPERKIASTSEVLLVQQGRCLADIYDDDKRLVATRELREGDVVLLVGGGHGFRMLEHTVLLEVKQGPYVGPGEKERF